MSRMTTVQLDQISGSVFDAASSVQKNQLGARCRIGPREYVYCSTAVDIAAGSLIGHAAPSAVTANALTAASAGAVDITLTLAGTTLNQYADGFLMVTDDTGQANVYAIKSNSAAGSGNAVTIKLYDPLLAAIDTTSDCVVVPCPYSKVIVGIAGSRCLGGAVRAAAAATAGTTLYFWAQVRGPGLVLVDTATSLGIGVPASPAASGGGIVVATATLQRVGCCLSAAEDAAGFQPIWFEID